jgi:hypothetical protein
MTPVLELKNYPGYYNIFTTSVTYSALLTRGWEPGVRPPALLHTHAHAHTHVCTHAHTHVCTHVATTRHPHWGDVCVSYGL